MYQNPLILSRGSPEILLIIVPVVLLFCWLFNAYQLGRCKRSKQGAPHARAGKRKDKLALWVIFLFIIATALLSAALPSLFG